MFKQWDTKTKYKSGALVTFKDKQYMRISDDEMITKCDTTSPDKPVYPWKLVSDTEQLQELTSTYEDKTPGKQLDLKNWYLTLPIGKKFDPLCIFQPNLDKYKHPKFFFVNEKRDAVVFVAHCDAVTTKGSKYGRSELRECTNNGKDKAAWDTEKGKHTMTYTACVTNVPKVKPSLIVGQIHATTQYLVLVKLIKGKLQVQHDDKVIGTLDDKFSLGTKFTVKIEVYNNTTYIYYNDMTNAKVNFTTKAKDCYFKIGSYNQSSTSTGDKAEEYAEVWVYDLKVEHTS
jgi:hypothetical protein